MAATFVRLTRRPWRLHRSATVIRTPGAADAWDRDHLGPSGLDATSTVDEVLDVILAPLHRPQFQDPLATWWADAPLPRRWHRCRPWQSGFGADRCACGAIRQTGTRRWAERNSRRPR